MTEDRETYLDSSVDDEDQLQPEDTLDDRDLEDVLDRGYSPPDRPPKGYDDYPTEAEMRRGESLDELLAEVHVGMTGDGYALPAEDLPVAVPLVEARRLERERRDEDPQGSSR